MVAQSSNSILLRHLRLSQVDKILSTQLRLEGALIRPAGVISCSVSAIQPEPRSNAGAPIKRPRRLIKNRQFGPGVRAPVLNRENTVCASLSSKHCKPRISEGICHYE